MFILKFLQQPGQDIGVTPNSSWMNKDVWFIYTIILSIKKKEIMLERKINRTGDHSVKQNKSNS